MNYSEQLELVQLWASAAPSDKKKQASIYSQAFGGKDVGIKPIRELFIQVPFTKRKVLLRENTAMFLWPQGFSGRECALNRKNKGRVFTLCPSFVHPPRCSRRVFLRERNSPTESSNN